jgi:hypothetical protein
LPEVYLTRFLDANRYPLENALLMINHCSRHQSKGAPALLLHRVKQNFFNRRFGNPQRSRGRGLRNRARYGLSLNQSNFFQEEET